MNRTSHKFVLSLVTLAAAALLTLSLARPQAASTTPAPRPDQQSQRVDTYLPPDAPLAFRHAVLSKQNGRAVLHYSFADSGNHGLESVELVALVLDSSGEVRRGQGWRVNVAPDSGGAVEGSVALTGEVQPTDQVLLTVWKARGGATNFTQGFSHALKSYRRARGLAGAAAGVAPTFVKARAQQTQNTCSASLAEAKTTYGCAGIKTFSCNPSNGQFSFECFPKSECHEAPPESDD